MNLIPKITRPSRITEHSATLIDNIFTNDIENGTVSGLLINDISDHLPIFIVTNVKNRNNESEKSEYYKRMRSAENLKAFKADLKEQAWNNIYETTDINAAYEHFWKIFTSLYNKNCPLQKCTINYKNNMTPWITTGLRKACRKKNKLYKVFICKRTKEAEIRYKQYKNKLVSIMRNSKKRIL